MVSGCTQYQTLGQPVSTYSIHSELAVMVVSEAAKPGMSLTFYHHGGFLANTGWVEHWVTHRFTHFVGPSQVGGRLVQYISNWMVITSDGQILQLVRGMQIDWVSQPPIGQTHQPRFQQRRQGEISLEVQKLLEKKAIERVLPSQQQFVSHIFLAPKKDGTKRPVFNLKVLNHSVQYEHFKMEGIPAVVDSLRPQDWMAKLDLKDAFFAIKICPRDRSFLRFRWQGQLYQYKVAPFGLGSVPRVFTKLLKPSMALLRRSGVRLVIYLDDILIMNQDRTQLEKHVAMTAELLQLLGLLINWEKSVLTPSQKLEYLGFQIDTTVMQLALPLDKLERLQEKCQDLITKRNGNSKLVAQ